MSSTTAVSFQWYPRAFWLHAHRPAALLFKRVLAGGIAWKRRKSSDTYCIVKLSVGRKTCLGREVWLRTDRSLGAPGAAELPAAGNREHWTRSCQGKQLAPWLSGSSFFDCVYSRPGQRFAYGPSCGAFHAWLYREREVRIVLPQFAGRLTSDAGEAVPAAALPTSALAERIETS